jgi:type VI protein secretion system component VasF
MRSEEIVDAMKEVRDADARMAQRLARRQDEPSAALLARVRAMPRQEPARPRRMPRLVWAAAAILLLAVRLTMASPSIRATLGVIQDAIGDVYLAITDRLSDDSERVVLMR